MLLLLLRSTALTLPWSLLTSNETLLKNPRTSLHPPSAGAAELAALLAPHAVGPSAAASASEKSFEGAARQIKIDSTARGAAPMAEKN